MLTQMEMETRKESFSIMFSVGFSLGMNLGASIRKAVVINSFSPFSTDGLTLWPYPFSLVLW
jgi:hypothetical protein